MTRNKTGKNFSPTSARALLVLSLFAAGLMALPQRAMCQEGLIVGSPDDNQTTAPPADNTPHEAIKTPLGTVVDPKGMEAEYGPNWRNFLAAHEALVAKFQQDEAKRRESARVVGASNERTMDDLAKAYPFLQDDFNNVKVTQQKALDYLNKNSDHSIDISPHIQIAESKDPATGINVLFVSKSGKLWCGEHGCTMDIYVDDGAGYKKTNEFLVSSDLFISRVNGQVAIYLGSPQDPNVPEWILKNHVFVKSRLHD